MNSLTQILQDLTADASVKIAAEKVAAPVTPVVSDNTKQAQADLLNVLKQAENAVASTKTASENQASPVADLTKMASDLATADHEALVKEAEFYGAAVADGFMSRVAQYETAAQALPQPNGTKTAQAVALDVEKIAADAVRGYVDARVQLEKQASDQYTQGYNDTIVEIEKVASSIFSQGAQDCQKLINQ